MKSLFRVCAFSVCFAIWPGANSSANAQRPDAKQPSVEELAGIAIQLHQGDLLVRALAKGANVNGKIEEFGGLNLLAVAVRQGGTDAISVLKQHGADLNQPSGSPLLTPLEHAVEIPDEAKMIALLRLGADPKVGSYAAARYAIENARAALLQSLFAAGVSPDASLGNGTSLFGSVLLQSDAVTKAIFKGCDPSRIPVVVALIDMARTSLAEKADTTKPVGNVSDALQFTAQSGEWVIGDAILDARAEIKPPLPGINAVLKTAFETPPPVGTCPTATPDEKAKMAKIVQFGTEIEERRRAFLIRLLRETLQ